MIMIIMILYTYVKVSYKEHLSCFIFITTVAVARCQVQLIYI